MACLGPDELRGDAQAIAGPAQASAKHTSGVEFPPDLRSSNRLVPICQNGCPRKYLQLLDLRQLSDDVFRHSIAEIFVVFARTEVLEIKHCDGFFLGGHCSLVTAG